MSISLKSMGAGCHDRNALLMPFILAQIVIGGFVVSCTRQDTSPGEAAGALRLVPDLSIAGTGTAVFGSLYDVVPLESGAIAVLDAGAERISIFRPGGEFVRNIGRGGSGPGEFSPAIRRILPVKGDRFVIPDPGLGRAQLVSSDGTVENSASLDFSSGKPVAWGSDPRGNSDAVIAGLRQLPQPANPQPDTMLTIARVHVLDWTITDSVRIRAGATIAPGSPTLTLLSAEPAWAGINESELVLGTGAEPRLSVVGWDGSKKGTINTGIARTLTSQRDRDVVRDLFLQKLKANGLPTTALDQMRGTIAVADNYPLYPRVISDGGERIWVQRTALAEDLRRNGVTELTARHLGSGRWEVYSKEGQHEATVLAPASLLITWIRGDLVYGIHQAEDGSQSAVRYRVVHGE